MVQIRISRQETERSLRWAVGMKGIAVARRSQNGSVRHMVDSTKQRGGVEVFIRMRRGLGDASASMGAALGAFDAFLNPGSQRAGEELHQANERRVPVPSPGDRLLHENRIVISAPSRPKT